MNRVYKNFINIPIDPQLKKSLKVFASCNGKTLKALVIEILREKIEKELRNYELLKTFIESN